jgi:dienelactone hydrolase
MKRMFFLAVVLALAFSQANASDLPPEVAAFDPRPLIHVRDQISLDAARQQLIRKVFARNALDIDASMTQVKSSVVLPGYKGAPNLSTIEQWRVDLPQGFKSDIHIFIPASPPNGLMIYHEGHDAFATRRDEFVRKLVAAGLMVAAIDMPLSGVNSEPVVVNDPALGPLKIEAHDHLSLLETAEFSPLRLFFEPVLAVVNHYTARGVGGIVMAGFSGGGWATSLYAAMDPRINASYSIAGSLPTYLRGWTPNKNSHGDYEQRLPGLLRHLSYLDIYIMAAAGGRSHLQVFMPEDTCCFAGRLADHYKDIVRTSASTLGGDFRVIYDTTFVGHDVSSWTTNAILVDSAEKLRALK